MEVLRYAAFTTDPAGGNPAGVVIDAATATVTDMQRIAAGLGYSETAFLVARGDPGEGDFDVRYFSPQAEVPFCGHATIASAVALAERFGTGRLVFRTSVGAVRIVTGSGPDGLTATLTSVATDVLELTAPARRRLLRALRLIDADLDPALPPRVAFAGAFHPILALRSRARLTALDYDFDQLRAVMAEQGWTTVDVVWRESATVFHARNPFPPGGIVEDPATGAAAAALGAYLRALGPLEHPADLTIHQGEDVGRPSLLRVHIPPGPNNGIEVSGSAVVMPA